MLKSEGLVGESSHEPKLQGQSLIMKLLFQEKTRAGAEPNFGLHSSEQGSSRESEGTERGLNRKLRRVGEVKSQSSGKVPGWFM